MRNPSDSHPVLIHIWFGDSMHIFYSKIYDILHWTSSNQVITYGPVQNTWWEWHQMWWGLYEQALCSNPFNHGLGTPSRSQWVDNVWCCDLTPTFETCQLGHVIAFIFASQVEDASYIIRDSWALDPHTSCTPRVLCNQCTMCRMVSPDYELGSVNQLPAWVTPPSPNNIPLGITCSLWYEMEEGPIGLVPLVPCMNANQSFCVCGLRLVLNREDLIF